VKEAGAISVLGSEEAIRAASQAGPALELKKVL
jgi:hypothetical protein